MIEPRRPGKVSLGAALGPLVLGAWAAMGLGCQAPCEMPAERITITLPDQIQQACNSPPVIVILDGEIERRENGFVLRGAGDSYAFPDTDVAIPTGTFARVAIQCVGFGASVGTLLIVQNLPSFQGEMNPTEDGIRFWAVVAGGGSMLFGHNLPFDYGLEEVCQGISGPEGQTLYVEGLVLIQGSRAIVVRPGEKGEIHVESGEQAGRYEVENVNIVFSGSDFPVDVNFRIRRAD